VKSDTGAPLRSSFRYRHVLEKGPTRHDAYDFFTIRHPPMDLTRRAKIFSPFDALKGFHDELATAQSEVTGTFLDDTFPQGTVERNLCPEDPAEEFP